jgi:hypothetical protein
MATIAWSATPGSNNLSTDANWVGGVKPTATDDATIGATSIKPASGTCVAANVTVSSTGGINGGTWSGSGTLTLSGGSASVGGAATFNMPVVFTGGAYCLGTPAVYNSTVSFNVGVCYTGTFNGLVTVSTLSTINQQNSPNVITFNAGLNLPYTSLYSSPAAAANVRFGTARYAGDTGKGTMPSVRKQGALR